MYINIRIRVFNDSINNNYNIVNKSINNNDNYNIVNKSFNNNY